MIYSDQSSGFEMIAHFADRQTGRNPHQQVLFYTNNDKFRKGLNKAAERRPKAGEQAGVGTQKNRFNLRD